MHNFPKPTHWLSTQELSVFKTGCSKDHVSLKTQRGVEGGDFVDCVLLPNFFHCCIRPTVKVVLCVTSSIGECGKIRLALDKNFCFFSFLISTEKRGFTRNSITPFKKKKPHYGSQMFCVFTEVAKWSDMCIC